MINKKFFAITTLLRFPIKNFFLLGNSKNSLQIHIIFQKFFFLDSQTEFFCSISFPSKFFTLFRSHPPPPLNNRIVNIFLPVLVKTTLQQLHKACRLSIRMKGWHRVQRGGHVLVQRRARDILDALKAMKKNFFLLRVLKNSIEFRNNNFLIKKIILKGPYVNLGGKSQKKFLQGPNKIFFDLLPSYAGPEA